MTEALDRSLLAHLGVLVADATAAFDDYDYARALERTERFFWSFCDDYLELVKQRAYGTEARARWARRPADARAHARRCCSACSPRICPSSPRRSGRGGRAVRCTAPRGPTAELRVAAAPVAGDADPLVYVVAADVLGAVRKAKSDAQRSLRADVANLRVTDTTERLAALEAARGDVLEAGRIRGLDTELGDEIAVHVEMVAADAG